MELKLGHRVIAWDDDKSEANKGVYVRPRNNKGDYVLLRDGSMSWFKHVHIDPEATEFLSGDEVEVLNAHNRWVPAIYIGETAYKHCVLYNNKGLFFKDCRYPQPKSHRESPEFVEKINEIQKMLEELK